MAEAEWDQPRFRVLPVLLFFPSLRNADPPRILDNAMPNHLRSFWRLYPLHSSSPSRRYGQRDPPLSTGPPPCDQRPSARVLAWIDSQNSASFRVHQSLPNEPLLLVDRRELEWCRRPLPRLLFRSSPATIGNTPRRVASMRSGTTGLRAGVSSIHRESHWAKTPPQRNQNRTESHCTHYVDANGTNDFLHDRLELPSCVDVSVDAHREANAPGSQKSVRLVGIIASPLEASQGAGMSGMETVLRRSDESCECRNRLTLKMSLMLGG